MRNAESLSHSQIHEFLKAGAGIEFAGRGRAEVYGWVERMLVHQQYQRLGKKRRGAVRAYLSKVMGLSLPRITRLIRAYVASGVVEAKAYRRRRFRTKYQAADIVLLAEVDRARERLSGPARWARPKTNRCEAAKSNRPFRHASDDAAPPEHRLWK